MAIAFDTTASANTNAQSSPATLAFTCGASANILVVGLLINNGSNDLTAVTGVTYNGVAMTKRAEDAFIYGEGYALQLWTLQNPSTGSSHNIAVSFSTGSIRAIFASSYAGASGGYDATNHGQSSGGSPAVASITTGSASCWQITIGSDNGSNPSASTGMTQRQLDAGSILGDSNGALSAGVNTMNFTYTGGSKHAWATISISPNAVTNVTVSPSVLSASFSIPTATVTAVKNATVSPSVLSATFSIPSVTVSTVRNVTVTASPITATFSIPAPSVVTPDVIVTASVVSAAFSIPASTVSTVRNVSITPSAAVAAFFVPAPSVSVVANVAVTPSPLTLTFSIPTPTVRGSLWQNETRSSTTFVNQARPTTNWTNETRNV